jgi:hypothetical protein
MKVKDYLLACSWMGCALIVASTSAQPAPRSLLSQLRSLAEVPQIKRKAEVGDCQAQLDLAHIAARAKPARPADALLWYRKAADQGNLEATYWAGDILLYGRKGNGTAQPVEPQPAEGLPLTYSAATNRYTPAYRNMSTARRNGLGCDKNLIEAYAWLRLYAEVDPVHRKAELDSLALQLTASQLDEAYQIALACKQGQWPPLNVERTAAPDTRFKLAGVTVGGRYPLAIINRKTIAEGETASIPIEGGILVVKCLKVNEDSVLIEVQGESGRKELTL